MSIELTGYKRPAFLAALRSDVTDGNRKGMDLVGGTRQDDLYRICRTCKDAVSILQARRRAGKDQQVRPTARVNFDCATRTCSDDVVVIVAGACRVEYGLQGITTVCSRVLLKAPPLPLRLKWIARVDIAQVPQGESAAMTPHTGNLCRFVSEFSDRQSYNRRSVGRVRARAAAPKHVSSGNCRRPACILPHPADGARRSQIRAFVPVRKGGRCDQT